MTIQTGHTYQTPTALRIRNLMAQVSDAQAEEAAAQSGGDLHEFERILTGYAMAEVNAHNSLITRRDEIERVLRTDTLTRAQAHALTEELAAIYRELGLNRLDDDEAADDFADYRREAICGVGL